MADGISRENKLSELEEKLKQPVTKENWREMYVYSFSYDLLNDYSYPGFNFIKVKFYLPKGMNKIVNKKIADLENISEEEIIDINTESNALSKLSDNNDIIKKTSILENIFKDLNYNIHNASIKIIEYSPLFIKKLDNYTSNFLYNHIKYYETNLTKKHVINFLYDMLFITEYIIDYTIPGNKVYNFINKTIINRINWKNELAIIIPLLVYLYKSDELREYFSVLTNPLKAVINITHPVDIISNLYEKNIISPNIDNKKIRIMKNINEQIPDMTNYIFFLQTIMGKEIQLDEVVTKFYRKNITNIPTPTSMITFPGKCEVDREILEKNLISILDKDDRDYIIRCFNKKIGNYKMDKFDNFDNFDYYTLSKNIRTIKKLREENKEVDYKKIIEYSDINIPGYLILGERGKGGSSDFYEGVRDGLEWRKIGIRIFDGNRNKSTSIEEFRNNVGVFRMFERGIELQELLSQEYDFTVKVYDWGKMNDEKFYSIEELIDCILEDKLKESERKRLEEFPKIFLETATILHVLHNGKDEIYKFLINEDRFPISGIATDFPLRKEVAEKYEDMNLIINNNSITLLHTDIKLDNIGFHKNKIKILDLSTAIINKDNKRDYYSGDRAYSAPEVISRNEYSKKSDVYSLGVCMFRYLTGEFPNDYKSYRHEEFDKLKEKLKKENAEKIYTENLEKQCKKIDYPWNSIISNCLSWRPNKRPDTYRLCLSLHEKTLIYVLHRY